VPLKLVFLTRGGTMSIRVLLVDDSELFIEVLALRLKARGMTVSKVTSVKEIFQNVVE
jgi:ActR/RegA family two-component response regulator